MGWSADDDLTPPRVVARRLDGVPPVTIFTEMSALAVHTGALNLGQGFPDRDGPDAVIEAVERALRSGRNQYAPGYGVPELRRAIADHQRRHYGLELDPGSEVLVTTGATEAIAAAMLGLLDPGDEVVLLEPYYDSYLAMTQMAGAVRRPVTLRAPDFRLDVEALRDAVTDRTRMILLNSPHNPTGAVLTAEELAAVAEVAQRHDVIVVTDEVYEHLTFDGVPHVPIATLPGMFERTLTISSAGKSFSFTGWKVGWATGPRRLVDAAFAAKQWLTFTSGAPLQPAVAVALDSHEDFHRRLASDLAAARDVLCDGLAGLEMEVYRPQGTYFATTDVSSYGWEDGLAFCRALPGRAGVVAIPTQVFYEDGAASAGRHLVRWAFCKEPSAVEEGLRRLAAADLHAP